MASPTKEMEKDARHGSGTMPAQLSAQREEESVGNHDTETLHKAPRRLTLAQRICNILGVP